MRVGVSGAAQHVSQKSRFRLCPLVSCYTTELGNVTIRAHSKRRVLALSPRAHMHVWKTFVFFDLSVVQQYSSKGPSKASDVACCLLLLGHRRRTAVSGSMKGTPKSQTTR